MHAARSSFVCRIERLDRGQTQFVAVLGTARRVGRDQRSRNVSLSARLTVTADGPLLMTSRETGYVYFTPRGCVTSDRGGGYIQGTEFPDRICGRRGADDIDPLAGKDYVYAGAGNDVINSGDKRADVISCGPGAIACSPTARTRSRETASASAEAEMARAILISLVAGLLTALPSAATPVGSGTIAYAIEVGSLYTVTADGRPTQPLRIGGTNDRLTSPRWSPNGLQVAFTEYRNDPITVRLWVMNADESNVHIVATGSIVLSTQPWSPTARGSRGGRPALPATSTRRAPRAATCDA